MNKINELKKKAADLLAQAKKLEAEQNVKLGALANKYLAGEINHSDFMSRAKEIGIHVAIPTQEG